MTIAPGARVYLRACRAGEAGTVVRAEHKRLVVFWPDMNYWSRHAPESLELAEDDEAKDEAIADDAAGA